MESDTPFALLGDLIGVEAISIGPTGHADALLVLDTGAVMTTVVPMSFALTSMPFLACSTSSSDTPRDGSSWRRSLADRESAITEG